MRPSEQQVRELMEEMRGRIERNEIPVARSAEFVASLCEDWLHIHADALLAAAERGLAADSALRAAARIDAALTPYFEALTQFLDAPNANADEQFMTAAERLEAARKEFREAMDGRGIAKSMSVEQVLREVIEALEGFAAYHAGMLIKTPGEPRYGTRAETYGDAAEWIKSIAAKHGIKLE